MFLCSYSDCHQKLVITELPAAVFVQLPEHVRYRLLIQFPETIVTETIPEFPHVQRFTAVIIHDTETSAIVVKQNMDEYSLTSCSFLPPPPNPFIIFFQVQIFNLLIILKLL